MNLTPIVFSQLKEIFDSKKWFENLYSDTIFDSFCTLCSRLNDEQQSLLLDLTRRYNWFTFNNYQIIYSKQFENLYKNNSNCKRIILFPIHKQIDEDVTKSGNCVLYLMKTSVVHNPVLQNVKIESKELFSDLEPSKLKLNPNDLFVLLDDYIGTGKTLRDTIDNIKLSNSKISNNNLAVVTIVSQFESQSLLSSQRIQLFAHLVVKKGITDFYMGDELKRQIEVMESIERLLKPNNYSFGYKKSEALVTLLRTPNNTFPIYWHEYEVNGDYIKCPFRRY